MRSDSLRLGGAAGMNWARVVVLEEDLPVRERVLFIGTKFSILYTSMYSPAEAATPRA